MTGYSSEITASSKEFTAREKIKIKDTMNAVKLDEATKAGTLTICPEAWAELSIHNENGEDKDYTNFVVIDGDGIKYTTGSPSFISAFMNIFEELKNETEPWMIQVYRSPSKNRQGKDFITCSLI